MIREIRALRKSGEPFDCEMAIREIAAPPGSAPIFTVVMRDITERKRVEEAEARANAARIERLERELRSLERLSGPSSTSVTAQSFGLLPLREGLSDTFNELVQRYGDILELALEQRAYKVEHNVSERLRSITEQMGFLKAGPRDVVEIHSTALKGKSNGSPPQRVQAYIEEGRLIVLEIMGYLTSYYRNYAIGQKK